MNRKLLAAAAVALLGIASPSWASPVTHSFEVVITGTVDSDGTYSGTFSYDTASIPSGGGNNAATGLLTDLDFDFLPKVGSALTHYDETSANTGYLTFDASGELVNVLFGTNCSAGSCSFPSFSGNWAFSWGSSGSNDLAFFYKTANGIEINGATSVSAAVPEPGTLALAGLAVAGLGLSRRRRAS